MEARLYEQEKIQGAIETAGAVCHGLNQPLQAAAGNDQLLLIQMKPEDPAYEKVNRIKVQVVKMEGDHPQTNGDYPI